MGAPTKHFFDIQRADTVRLLYMALMRFLIKVKWHDLPDVSNACKYKKTVSLTLTVLLAGVEGFEPSARGFGDRCSTN